MDDDDHAIKPVIKKDEIIVLSPKCLPAPMPIWQSATLWLLDEQYLFEIEGWSIYAIGAYWVAFFYFRSKEHHWDFFHKWR